jgi:hypothetical protein
MLDSEIKLCKRVKYIGANTYLYNKIGMIVSVYTTYGGGRPKNVDSIIFDVLFDGFQASNRGWIDGKCFISIDDEIVTGLVSLDIKEKPCNLCKNMNDIGVNICWSCGTKQ